MALIRAITTYYLSKSSFLALCLGNKATVHTIHGLQVHTSSYKNRTHETDSYIRIRSVRTKKKNTDVCHSCPVLTALISYILFSSVQPTSDLMSSTWKSHQWRHRTIIFYAFSSCVILPPSFPARYRGETTFPQTLYCSKESRNISL
jgi:hypothetical protein